MIERRYPRVLLRVPLFVTVGKGRLYERAVTIESRDISGGGLSFETKTAIPLDAKSRIVMGRLGNLPSSALIEGRVVYCRPHDGAEERYTVGVEFLEFVNTTRDEVLASIDSWQSGDDTKPHSDAHG